MFNKKASVQMIIIMIAIVFIMAIAALVFSKVFLMITTELKGQEGMGSNTIETLESVEDKTIPLLDFAIFFSLIALMIGMIIASIYMEVHPAIVIVLIVALIVGVLLAGQMSNVFSEITAESELEATASEFKLTNVVLGSHFPLIILVTGIIVIIILYGKSRSPGGAPI